MEVWINGWMDRYRNRKRKGRRCQWIDGAREVWIDEQMDGLVDKVEAW